MPPINVKSFTMPLAAFGMVFVLGGCIHTAMGRAKAGANQAREEMMPKIMKSREQMGIDVWDQRTERERLRKEMEGKRAAIEAAAGVKGVVEG